MLNYKKTVVDATWGDRDLQKYLGIYDADFGRIIKKYLKSKQCALEIGFGQGELLYWLSDRFEKVDGVEIDKDMYKSASRYVKKRKNIRIFNKDIFDYLNKKKKRNYDLIIINEVLEHIEKEKILQLLILCYESLASKGLVLIRTPSAESPFFGSYYRYIDLTHTTSFTRKSLIQFLVTSGFDKNDIKVMPTYHRKGLFPFFAYLIRMILENIFSVILFLYLGSEAFRLIYTPNLIVVAKKQK